MPHSTVSLGHLVAQSADILFVCSECDAQVTAPMAQVVDRFGYDTLLGDIQARAVCKHCGSIEVVLRPTAQHAA